ncbi:hypothetical protein [Parvibaculum sp.]
MGPANQYRHDPLYAGHPRLYCIAFRKDVDGPDKPGHDEREK